MSVLTMNDQLVVTRVTSVLAGLDLVSSAVFPNVGDVEGKSLVMHHCIQILLEGLM